MGSVTAVVILAAAIALSVVTNNRVGAAFSDPLTYARSFFDPKAVAPYSISPDGSNVISIEFDPATGQVVRPAEATRATQP